MDGVIESKPVIITIAVRRLQGRTSNKAAVVKHLALHSVLYLEQNIKGRCRRTLAFVGLQHAAILAPLQPAGPHQSSTHSPSRCSASPICLAGFVPSPSVSEDVKQSEHEARNWKKGWTCLDISATAIRRLVCLISASQAYPSPTDYDDVVCEDRMSPAQPYQAIIAYMDST